MPRQRALALPLILGAALTASATGAAAQAVANDQTDVSVAHPAYARGAGPVVALDEGHNDYHTLEGRYGPFGAVLANDGFRLEALRGRFDAAALGKVRVLVVANPLAASNAGGRWTLPTPSAFDADEIAAVKAWVRGGGALFLIADHMPFAGAMSALAEAFGVKFDNAYAVKDKDPANEVFSRDAGALADNAVTRGAGRGPAVTQVQSFTGSSFRAPPGAMPIMTLGDGWTLLYPAQAGKFDADTPRRKTSREDLRGAALSDGKGRVVVVSEAAMFTNQLVNGAPYGFGQSSARQDKQLLINIVEWLSRTF